MAALAAGGPVLVSRLSARTTRSATAVSLLVLQAVAARAQTPVGFIEGVVRDSLGRPIDAAQVLLLGSDAIGASSQVRADGKYRISVPAGTAHLLVRMLGYQAQRPLVEVVAGKTTHIDFKLIQAPAIGPEVVVVADPTRGKMGAFNRRKARGVGSFVTRDEIERRKPASMSELLRTLPGVHISQRMAGEPQPVDMQRSRNSSMQSTCVVQLYVDGQAYPNGNVDDFAPLSVEGVEVYRSASEIPADFRSRNATCGVIALWTRDPDAARRKP
jgi:hypothetical protein